MFFRVRRRICQAQRDFCPSAVAVLVLGMHRSGTSSVAGTLIRLGGDAPLHLMEPKAGQRAGVLGIQRHCGLERRNSRRWRKRLAGLAQIRSRTNQPSRRIGDAGARGFGPSGRIRRSQPPYHQGPPDVPTHALLVFGVSRRGLVPARSSAAEVAARGGMVAPQPHWHCAELRLSALVTPRSRGRGRNSRDAPSGLELAGLSRRSIPRSRAGR